jgi:hypothetical protein
MGAFPTLRATMARCKMRATLLFVATAAAVMAEAGRG